MNKQRYLAELEQLLVFMTRADREQTIHRYGAMFDDAGPNGEEALADELGSPTRVAIRLSRDYIPGQLDASAAPASAADRPDETAAPAPVQELTLALDDLPQFELPEMDLPGQEPQPESEPQTPAPEKPAPAPRKEPRDWRVIPLEEPDGDVPGRLEQEQIVRTMPLGVGIPLFVLAMVLVGVPVGVVLLGLFAALLCPGLGVLIGAWLVFVGGLWCISYIADAILMFGLAFLVLCVGILVLWCGFWVGFHLVKLYVLGVRSLAGLLLGKKVKGNA